MIELNPINQNATSTQKKHTFLKRSGTKPKKQQTKPSKLAQNNGLIGFNKGMTYGKKGNSKVKLAPRKNYIPPGGQSSLNLFSETNIPDPRELRKQTQLRPLSQEQPGREYNSQQKFDSPSISEPRDDVRQFRHDEYHHHSPKTQRSSHNKNNQNSNDNYDGYNNHSRNQNNQNRNDNYDSYNNNSRNQNNQNRNDNYDSYNNNSRNQNNQNRNDNYDSYNNNSRNQNNQNRNDNYDSYNYNSRNQNKQEVFGQARSHVSSNTYANGANQNCGNVMTERSSTRVHAPPGGSSSFSLAHEENSRHPQDRKTHLKPLEQRKEPKEEPRYSEEGGGNYGGAENYGGKRNLKPIEQRQLNSKNGIGALLQKAKQTPIVPEFGQPLHQLQKSQQPMQSKRGKQPLAPIQAAQHNPIKVPGLENHYNDRQRKQFSGH